MEFIRKQEAGRTEVTEDRQTYSIDWSGRASFTLEDSSRQRPFRVAFFTSHPANVGSDCERLIYNTTSALIARGLDARVYVMNAHMDGQPPFFARQLPTLPFERLIEKTFSRVMGWNDILFPSTGFLRFSRWIGSADIWHFHNLHGHYMSIPLLGLISWTKCIVISPVDQYLSTGHCPYIMGCERYLHGCGSCERLDEPWPGISRDATYALWQIKRLFFHLSKVNMLFHTQALADHYERSFVRHRPSRVLHYGVDINCYRQLNREDCAQTLGVEPSSRFVVGIFHSYLFDKRKGMPTIIEKLGDLAKKFPGKIDLLVVGHGSDELKDAASQELSVTALPYLNHAHELAKALNLCDVLLYPTQAENLSLTCLYALACGIPIISFDAGGQKEAIEDGVNGFIVGINDYEGMVKALQEMLLNPALCRQLSKGARNTTKKHFDFDRYIDDLVNYYNEVI
jgi:glycosyltransferase involved in cell wall biosynthesis